MFLFFIVFIYSCVTLILQTLLQHGTKGSPIPSIFSNSGTSNRGRGTRSWNFDNVGGRSTGFREYGHAVFAKKFVMFEFDCPEWCKKNVKNVTQDFRVLAEDRYDESI